MNIDFITRFALEGSDERVKVTISKLFGSAAVGTNEMMRVPVRGGDITVTAIVEMDTANVPQLGQQVQCAIHGDKPEMWILSPRAFVNFRRREMMVRCRDDIENRLTRAGQFATVLTQAVAHSGGIWAGHLNENDFQLAVYRKCG